MIEEKVTIHHGKLKRIPVILQFGPVARVDVAVSSAVCYVTYMDQLGTSTKVGRNRHWSLTHAT